MSAIFDYERVLQKYIDYHYSGEDRQLIGWMYFIQHLCGIVVLAGSDGEPERVVSENDPTKDKPKPTLLLNRDYYKIDYFDFIEYATSPTATHSIIFSLIPPESMDFVTQKRQILFYDSIFKNGDEPLFDSCLGGFDVDCAFLYPINSRTVLTGLRVKNRQPDSLPFNFPKYMNILTTYMVDENAKDFIQTSRSFLLENHQDNYPFLLQTETNSLCGVKIDRYGHVEQLPEEDEDEETVFEEGISAQEFEKRFIKYNIRNQNDEIMDSFNKEFQIYFETSRLLLSLPDYIDFMYDLIIPEKIKVGERTVKKVQKTKQGKRKIKRVVKPIYKIIKSIKVRYLEENRLRDKGNISERNYTPPSYRYIVRGHWRKLTNSKWEGHDPAGNIVLGKTWIHDYSKGDDATSESVILERQPDITIKIKQPLSYGRDVIESYKQKGGIGKEQLEDSSIEKPSSEWMYNERQKLTSALRFFIFKRDDFQCQICGQSASDNKKIRLEADHKTPLIEWGLTEPDNLWTLCSDCNRGKGAHNL